MMAEIEEQRRQLEAEEKYIELAIQLNAYAFACAGLICVQGQQKVQKVVRVQ